MRNKLKPIFSVAIQLAILLAAAHAVEAQVYGGRAIGIQASITSGSTTNYVSTDTGQLPSSGGDVNASSPSFLINGTLSTGVMTASASGALKSSQANAVVNDFVFRAGGVTVQANRITTNAGCICCPEADLGGCAASTRISGLVITDATGAQTIVSVTGEANQVVNLAGGLGTITINEQTGGTGGISVNGLHIRAASGGTTYDVTAANAQATLQCLTTAPSAGPAMLTGKVVTKTGQGISRVSVSLTDENGSVRTTVTNSLGNFVFSDVPSGKTYILSAVHRTYSFTAQAISVDADMSVNLTAN